ncbi:MAG: P-loop NTPase [Acidobacteriota bacterium]
MAIKRIIPVSSGKGGVGKTTFAVNFSLALSEHGRCVLVDLDTGTSSVRNAIDVPVQKDLYHFFKKDEPLAGCITSLDWKLDPLGRFRNFGFVAGPLHLIDDITNFGPDRKQQLIQAINGIDADYIVLDMKSGVDANVLDFLPWSNSGILVFTPHLPSATFAASDIVKAILFRKLRLIFSKGSPFFETVSGKFDFWRLTNELIDRVEDVYDPSIGNLDEFTTDLFASLGDHPIATTVASTIDEFRVYYLLNLFHGVDESFETAVRPFVENVTRNVSSHCGITNLGWINRSEAIHRANCERVPALLFTEKRRQPKPVEAWESELENLRVTAIGLKPKTKVRRTVQAGGHPDDATDHLRGQLDLLKSMFAQRRDDDYRANFEYVTQRALFTINTRRAAEFGEPRIYRPGELLNQMYASSKARGLV